MESLTFLESRVSQVFLLRFIHTSLKKLSSGDSQTKRKGKGRINTPVLILCGLTGMFDVKGKKIHRLRLTSDRWVSLAGEVITSEVRRSLAPVFRSLAQDTVNHLLFAAPVSTW